ncbi:hypothetical protein GWK47_038759 [Chionoecetes opilio]|uniref:Uncharacterized protein n=1 Tax=Chionoecetes opilio TaxID=41210 RepID=A0A8J4YCB4_CHIOP|nr:hypothetical protein GWK47_038759 [Chionoecetes opilio]
MLGKFYSRYYDKTSPLVSVNEARKELFCPKNRTMENIPPNSTGPAAAHQAVQCTRLASGQPVTRPNNRHQLLKAAVGPLEQKQSLGSRWSSQPAAAKAVSEF